MMKVWGVEVGRLSSWQFAVCRLQVDDYDDDDGQCSALFLRFSLSCNLREQPVNYLAKLLLLYVARCTRSKREGHLALEGGKGNAEMAASLWRKQQVVMRRNMVQNISIRKRRVAGTETERRRNGAREL